MAAHGKNTRRPRASLVGCGSDVVLPVSGRLLAGTLSFGLRATRHRNVPRSRVAFHQTQVWLTGRVGATTGDVGKSREALAVRFRVQFRRLGSPLLPRPATVP